METQFIVEIDLDVKFDTKALQQILVNIKNSNLSIYLHLDSKQITENDIIELSQMKYINLLLRNYNNRFEISLFEECNITNAYFKFYEIKKKQFVSGEQSFDFSNYISTALSLISDFKIIRLTTDII